ncbi:unnamed protein product [Diamesa serratosioi]
MGNPNNLNTGMQCIKFMIFIISVMFGLTAFLLLAVGSTITTIFGDFSIFVDQHFVAPATLIVVISICLMLVSICGCIGALKESTMIINIFGLLLLVVFIMEVAAAISAYVMHGQVTTMLIRTMNESFMAYDDNEYMTKGIDFLQTNLECCGIDSPDDWSELFANDGLETSVPNSCCESIVLNAAGKYECDIFFEHGCLPRLNFMIRQSAMLIATGASTVAFVQFLGVVCAFMLAKSIRHTKSIRAARRCQLQQSLGVLSNPFSFDKQTEITGRQYYPDPEYTQMDTPEKSKDSMIYLPNSPSVM